MRFTNYLLTEKVKMPIKQRKRFEDMIEEFFVEYPNYKQVNTEKFMADLEKFDRKAMSVLLNNLKIESIAQFINKYQEVIDRMHEAIDWTKDWSSPERKVIKKKYDKILSIVSAKAEYGKTEYIVELIGDKWPPDSDIIKYCKDASFGGKVMDGLNKKQKYVYVNNS